MGFFDNIKKMFVKEKEPDTEEYKGFKKSKELRLDDIKRFQGYIEQYSNQVKTYENEGRSKNDPIYKSAKNDLERFTYSLYEAQKSIDFIRPNTQEDIEYRKEIGNNFADNLKKIMPESLDLRFHGTPIYFAKEILKSGIITSSADRFDGYIRSTDSKGEFSVSDTNSLQRTVNWFLDIEAHQRNLPCGALFVLTSDGQTEQQHRESLMDTVNFKENPERLYAIVSTPENMSNIKSWVAEVGLSTNLVHTFKDFVQEIEKISAKEHLIEDERIDIDIILDNLKQEKENKNDLDIDFLKNKDTHSYDEISI